ncbi:MAG: presqualene diphosphate synthase HpnD [Proteobacteria bacterium]|nr:presqualene diphosphate synthase HpnD [Pseudomonadota bacterium]
MSAQAIEPAASARAAASRARSSFAWAMRTLPRARRAALYAIYAFCREIDDVADGPASAAEKLARLADWRAELARLFAGEPRRPETQALAGPVAAFALPRAEFEAIIDGLEMDARGEMVRPCEAALRLYCRRVAGAVGLLSLPVFGCKGGEARAFALALGEALQLTNILRDLEEDAAMGRLYLPEEVLAAAGIGPGGPAEVLAHARLAAACEALAARAERCFAAAEDRCRESARVHGGFRPLRPAIVMMAVYRRLLARVRSRGWPAPAGAVRLGAAEKLWIALRHGLVAGP